MSLWLRIPLALVPGATGAFVAFLVLFIAAGLLSPGCPPAVDVCDLPGIAAFGLALMGAPVVGLVVSWVAFRQLGEWDV
ncbi:MAG TPA: hypothetical protein VHQ45_17585 [Gemmatimonadaceae bacterium]|nr:hypothetical protein [Gemmatimonadaceae bacterium]